MTPDALALDGGAPGLDALQRHAGFLRRLARALLADPAEAEDLVQDTWLVALRGGARGARPRAWLAAVARNLAHTRNRAGARRTARERAAARPDGAPSCDEVWRREDLRRDVVRAVTALREPYRSAVLLRFYEGLPPREIAARLDVPVETVRSRLRRGLAELRGDLDRRREGWAALLAPLARRASPGAGSAAPLAAAIGPWIAVAAAASLVVALVLWSGGRTGRAPTAALAQGAPAPALEGQPSARAPSSLAGGELAAPSARRAVGAEPGDAGSADSPLRGVVVDRDGAPVHGALIYLGNQIRARGDEPFKPFLPERIEDGVRTGPDGAFELRGEGREVTAWHPELSPVTVPRADAERIELPPHGAVAGRALDASGTPLVHARIALDRLDVTWTDVEGRFRFDGVDAGERGLSLRFAGEGREDHRLVVVEPAAVARVDLRPGRARVEVAVTSGGAPWLDELEGGLIGLEPGLGVAEVEAADGRFEAAGVPDGAYLLMAEGGLLAEVDVRGARARADLGTAALTVAAPPGTRVYVVPAGSGELLQLLAGRLVKRAVTESGETTFRPLPAGRYDVGIDRLGVFATAEATPAGGRVALDP